MDVYSQIAVKIVTSQEQIIGPVAIEQARQVPELSLDWENHVVTISGSGPVAIDHLVAMYKRLFGQVSVEVCKEAANPLLSNLAPGQLPLSLR